MRYLGWAIGCINSFYWLVLSLILTVFLTEIEIHPGAVRKAREEDIELKESKDFDTFEGKGVVANIEGQKLLIGSKVFLKEINLFYPKEAKEKVSQLENEGKTVILIASSNSPHKIYGIIAVADSLKRTTRDAIEELKKMKLNCL
ncbi:HAD family hydrolase [Candidatus Aerophobetes bacterium]|nr:HAD family hydrolase [Candidatus Aerophobetes bacterium]